MVRSGHSQTKQMNKPSSRTSVSSFNRRSQTATTAATAKAGHSKAAEINGCFSHTCCQSVLRILHVNLGVHGSRFIIECVSETGDAPLEVSIQIENMDLHYAAQMDHRHRGFGNRNHQPEQGPLR